MRLMKSILFVVAAMVFVTSVAEGQSGDWEHTHTADETYLNSKHLYCDSQDLETAKETCDALEGCNSFNWRASDHTVCFKSSDVVDGFSIAVYHATATGYDVWVKNPQSGEERMTGWMEGGNEKKQ